MRLEVGKVYRYEVHPGVAIEVEPVQGGILLRTDHPGFVLKEDGAGPDLRFSLLAMESRSGDPCDKCLRRTDVRRLEPGGGAGLNLCSPCWGAEMRRRRDENRRAGKPLWPLLRWVDGMMDAMEYYTFDSARAMVGKRFRATAGYCGVPAGTVGRVTGIYEVNRWSDWWGIEVTWESIPPTCPLDTERGGLTDGFSRKDLEMVFTGGPNVGERAMVEVKPDVQA